MSAAYLTSLTESGGCARSLSNTPRAGTGEVPVLSGEDCRPRAGTGEVPVLSGEDYRPRAGTGD
jgi:hypothetical protein